MTQQRVLYIPHDEVPGVDLPALFWNPQTGAFEFGSMRTPVDVTFYGNVNLAGSMFRARAQMNNCGTQNLNGVAEGDPLPMPFGQGVADAPLLTIVGPGVIQVNVEGWYLLSYSLPFESDTGLILQGTSVGACWQWWDDQGQSWIDLIQTKTFDTVHGVADDHGALTLPPVEQQLAAGTLLRVVGFQVGTAINVYINSNDAPGEGPYDWSWARVEAFRVMTAPPPPPVIT
jgi:hypothetical protein